MELLQVRTIKNHPSLPSLFSLSLSLDVCPQLTKGTELYSPAYLPDQLEDLVCEMLSSSGLVDDCAVDPVVLAAFVKSVRARMDDGKTVAYHNWMHVIDVFQVRTITFVSVCPLSLSLSLSLFALN